MLIKKVRTWKSEKSAISDWMNKLVDINSNENRSMETTVSTSSQTDTIQKNRWQRLKVKFLNFNIFQNVESVNDEWETTTERISTRLFFFLLIVTVIILFAYTILSPDIIRETISSPSQTTYENLLTLYPNSLQCPCSQSSITYSSFISIDPTFHPVCASDFVSRNWIEFLFDYNESYYSILDFRSTGSNQFQLLAALCQLANASFNLAQKNIIDASTLISVQLISPESLLVEANALIQQFRSVSPNSFVQILNLIRGLTAGNKLVPTISTLFHYRLMQVYSADEVEIVREGGTYIATGGSFCYCHTQATCSSPSGFYPYTIPRPSWDYYIAVFRFPVIPGFVTGCYALESLLQSTLECFFNQTCVDFVQTNVKTFHTFNFTAIHGKSMKLFTPTWTIEQIISQLMIDQWESSVSYQEYFNRCRPLSCTFLHVQRHNSLYIVTTLIGLMGGLVSALQLLVPPVVRFIRNWRNRKKNGQLPNVSRPPLLQRVYAAISWMKMRICTLNIFANPHAVESEQSQRRGQIATRVYFVTFGVILSILIFYSLFSLRLRTVIIERPSQEEFEHLHLLYSSTLKCPCTEISIAYNAFMSINPVYHPICSSQFVSSKWIDSILNEFSLFQFTFYKANDFHVAGPAQMILIQRLCTMVLTTVNDSWNIFQKQQFVSALVLSRDQFVNEVQPVLNQFELNTAQSFKSRLNLIDMFIQGNQLLVADSDSMKLSVSYSTGTKLVNIELVPWTYSNKTECLCALTSTCRSSLTFYFYSYGSTPVNSVVLYTFSSLYLGCVPVNSLLQSTFSCFFDQTCIDAINFNSFNLSLYNTINLISAPSINVSKLNASTTHFDPSSTILDIVYQLMIEEWQSSIIFNQYYSTCKPSLCTYTYEQRFDYLYIVTTLLALFGGLNITLRLISPLVVKAIIRCRLSMQISLRQQLNIAYKKLKQTVIMWNLFENIHTHIDEVAKYHQQISTRFYVFFLVCTLFALTMCRSFSYEFVSRSINNPSISDIEYLKEQYQSLDCPCVNISIPYSEFVTIKSRQHPICSSDFVSSQWQEKLYQNGTFNSYRTHDFRRGAFAQFQLLSLLCQLTNTTLYDSLKIFQTSSLITFKVVSIASFNSTVDAAIEQFYTTTSRQFLLTLEFIRYMMHGNGIQSALQTNWKYKVFNMTYFQPIYSNPISYDKNCTCGTSPLCSQPAAMFFNTTNTYDYLLIPGMKVGCYPLESLLQSTLECFYQQSCIDLIATNINPSYQLNLTPLNITNNIGNLTINMLLADLFIVEWQTSIDYNAYFASCQPLTCSYSYVRRLSLLYVFTTLLGLYGGIAVVFRAIIPLGVKAIFKCQHYLYYRRRIAHVPT